MKLSLLIQDILTPTTQVRRNFLSATKGEEVENYLKAELDRRGFNRIMPKALHPADQKVLTEVRKSEKDGGLHKTNPLVLYDQHYLEQPNGKQAYPDFIILEGARIFSLESKFKAVSGPPMWNSGLPRPHGIYLLVNPNDITAFIGGDVVGDDDRVIFDEYRQEYRKLRDRTNGRLRGQQHGFGVYDRFALEQKGDKRDFFTHPNRRNLESRVIQYLSDTEPIC